MQQRRGCFPYLPLADFSSGTAILLKYLRNSLKVGQFGIKTPSRWQARKELLGFLTSEYLSDFAYNSEIEVWKFLILESE